MLENLLGHALGQLDSTVILVNFDAANMLTIDFRLIGYGTDDIARLHLVITPHLDTKALHADIRLAFFR